MKKTILLTLWCALLLNNPALGQKSWELGPFTRPIEEPVISPDASPSFQCPMRNKTVHWMSNHTFNPAAIVRDGAIHLLFRAEDGEGDSIGTYTSRVGHASSNNGVDFKISPKPVLFPDDNPLWQGFEWYGGCEDPRVAKREDEMYALYYTQWNLGNPQQLPEMARIGVATSYDLRHWQKHGPIFSGSDPVPDWHKSGAVIHEIRDGQLVAAKINGKYWMYWGEHGIKAATSDDLIHWHPVRNDDQTIRILIKTRAGYFDSELAEVGPPPILTNAGIVVIYNGKNAAAPNGDPSYPVGAYTAGQVLFSKIDPTEVIDRADTPFLIPELPYERSGQYGQGTVFAEGLVLFNNVWHLYFGAADSYVGTATAALKEEHRGN